MRPRPLLLGALTGVGFAILFLLLLRLSPSLFGLEWLWSDVWTRRAATGILPSPRIAIVAINDKSIRSLEELNYGRPPWTRELMARVVEEAARGGARVVVFDLLFSEAHSGDPAGDRRFAQALGLVPVVLGAQTGGTGSGLPIPPEWREALWRVDGAPRLDPVPLLPPHPLFAAARQIGTMRLRVERRASIARRYGTVEPTHEGGWVPSLALAAAAAERGLEAEASWSTAREGSVLRVGDLKIPVDDQGTFAIRWYGGKSAEDAAGPQVSGDEPVARRDALSYPAIDFDRIILASLAREEGLFAESEIDAAMRETFEGKIILVGNTATGLFDLRSTPLSPITAGVEIHANALDNLLRGDVPRPVSLGLFVALLLSSAALFGAVAAVLDSQTLSGTMVVVAAGGWLAATPLLMARNLIAPAVAPALAVAATWIAITAVRFVAEKRRSSLLKATFGRYVSPQILDYLLAHPEKLRLGGERRDLTILFSDIRGFTTISEASEPEEVVEMLNEYLTSMVEILLRHGGTLDKFIGDAVMGFWNAPTLVADHPRRAVLCAIEMVEETARLRQEWSLQGKPEIRIGVGVNTGEAVVGNIGSSRVFGYTVIGDAVNLASRLEGKNKDYATEIIVSETTRERMGDDIPAFYLDEVRVKGKQQAVKIYQIRGSS